MLARIEDLIKTPRDGAVEVPQGNEYRPSPEQLWENAAVSVVRALAQQDAPAALAIARKVKDNRSYRALSIALAAQGHDAAAAAPLFVRRCSRCEKETGIAP
jgi:hypothetical protein